MTIKEVWSDFDCASCGSSLRFTAATQGCKRCFPGYRITTGVSDPRIEVLCRACFCARNAWELPVRHVHRDPAMATPIDTDKARPAIVAAAAQDPTVATPVGIEDLCNDAARIYFVEEGKRPQKVYYRGCFLAGNYNDPYPRTASYNPPAGAVGHWMTAYEFQLYLVDGQPHGSYRRVQAAARPAIAAAAAAGLPSSPFPAGSFRGFIFQAAQEARWDADMLRHLSEILKDAYDTVQERARQGFFKAGTPQEGREAKYRNFKEEVQDGFYLRCSDPQVLDQILSPGTGLLDQAIARAMDLERDTQ